jgi:uncharacterized protein YdhG (YjbR/CyaY superfamily)
MGACKSFCSFYAMSGSLLGKFKDELKEFEQTKSAIHFTAEKPIPIPLLKKIIKARIVENELRANRKKVN